MFHGMTTSGLNTTLWYKDCELPSFPELSSSLAADVCIIGGGISGLSTAYNLLKQGLSVVLIEDGKLCSGETGRTSGHLASAFDDGYYKVEKKHGLDTAKLIADSHMTAIDTIERISHAENIDCNFKRVNGYLFLHENDTLDSLKNEFESAKKVGLSPIHLEEHPTLKGIKIPSSLVFSNQAKFHPLKYLTGLTHAIIKMGGKIFEKTHASKIKPGTPIEVTTKNNIIITAKHVVIATNATVSDKNFLSFKQEANRTYMIAAEVEKNQIEDALFWDTGDPYYYVRIHEHTQTHDLVSIGGSDHRTGSKYPPHEKFEELKSWATRHLPNLGEYKYSWSGQILEPVDFLAFIGRQDPKYNLYTVSGDSGNGLTHGVIASILLTDLILDKDHPWEKIYSPQRSFIKSMPSVLMNTIKGGHGYTKYFTPGECPTAQSIPPNEGAIIRNKLHKDVVYCDNDKKLHEHSAVCPHMGAILEWNPTEHTWDCPAHGSRFTVYGEVINGPANKNLNPVKDKTE